MPQVAGEVEHIIPADPKLAEDIYRAVFTYAEKSDERTTMVGGIVALTSTRRQDYDMARFELAEAYPIFLSIAPLHATEALIASLDAYVDDRQSSSSRETTESPFCFKGKQAYIRDDHSVIWDAGQAHQHDDPLKMLGAFDRYLSDLARTKSQLRKIREVVDTIVEQNSLAVVWRHLLVCGSKEPTTLGREILPLAWAIPILASRDTTNAVGTFLCSAFDHASTEEKERIEHAILSIPDSGFSGTPWSAEKDRNRLLGCLPSDLLTTEEARRILSELRESDSIPPNQLPYRPVEVTWEGPYGEKEYLADEGVQVEAEANKRIQELEKPVADFAERHRNSSPTMEQVEAVFPALYALREALGTSDAAGVHPKQSDYGWGCLAEGCERVTSTERLSSEPKIEAFVRKVLLQAAMHPDPIHRPESDSQFDEFQSWGSPAARIEAAAGLPQLARHATPVDPRVLEAVDVLSRDPVPAVRYQVAVRLTTLYRSCPELMWSILKRLCYEEESRGVLQGVLSYPLQSLAGEHPDKIVEFVGAIYERVRTGAGARAVRNACLSIFLNLYLWQGNLPCRDQVLDVAMHPVRSVDEARRIVLSLRDLLTYGPVDPTIPAQDAVRGRAINLMEIALDSTIAALQDLEDEYGELPFGSWPEDKQELMRSLGQLIDSVAAEILFASGAFEEKKQQKGEQAQTLGIAEKQRFFAEMSPLLDKLTESSFPSVTHNLLKTLQFFVPLDPAKAFLRIGQALRAGQSGGYQYDPLAVDLVVGLIERYLAEYRTVFRESKDCQLALLEILDIFVRANWPRARRLTYRMDEIFR
jgi:hypothetical protein